MEEFKITMSNTPGALADMTKQIAEAGANIEAISAIVPHMWDDAPKGPEEGEVHGYGTVCIITDDAESTRYALRGCGAHYTAKQVHEKLLTDKVGSLSDFLNQKSRKKINITSLQVLSHHDHQIRIGYTTD